MKKQQNEKLEQRINKFIADTIAQGKEGTFKFYLSSNELPLVKRFKQQTLDAPDCKISVKVDAKHKAVILTLAKHKEFLLEATDKVITEFLFSNQTCVSLESYVQPILSKYPNLHAFKDNVLDHLHRIFEKGVKAKGHAVKSIKKNSSIYLSRTTYVSHIIHFTNVRNRPHATISSLQGDVEYEIPEGISAKQESVNNNLMITLKLKDLHEFLSFNNISEASILVSDTSISHFYVYKDTNVNEHITLDNLFKDSVYFTNPTDAIVEGWWKANNPTLLRVNINLLTEANINGDIRLLSSDLLISNIYVEGHEPRIYASPEVTENEVNTFFKNREDTKAYKAIKSTLELQQIS